MTGLAVTKTEGKKGLTFILCLDAMYIPGVRLSEGQGGLSLTLLLYIL